jgi:hypothetical protein
VVQPCFFNNEQGVKGVKSNYHSLLYYKSEVCDLRSLKTNIKNQLQSVLANAIQVGLHYPDPFKSFIELHKQVKTAIPEMFGLNKLFLLLYKTFNEAFTETE